MKRILTILAATLLLTAAMAGTASASSYDSVAEELSAIGVFRGTAGGFELDRAPTRSEAAIMLVRLYGAEDEAKAAYEAGEISMPFTDVSAGAWYFDAVGYVYVGGLMDGVSDARFAPDGTVTRPWALISRTAAPICWPAWWRAAPSTPRPPGPLPRKSRPTGP